MENPLPAKRPREPVKFKMDEKGKLFDDSGKEVDTSAKNRLSLQVNQERFEKKKKKSLQFSAPSKKTHSRGQFFDKNLPSKKKTKFSSMFSSISSSLTANLTPLIEWWDKEIVDTYSSSLSLEKLKNPVQPANLPCPDPLNSTTHLPTIHLTPKEKKKLKRLQKLRKIKETQDKVKLGLIEPPEPKTKLTSLMKIMAKELAIDPSKTEQEIMEKYNKRIQKHLERNEKNKLNHAQKVDKMIRKLKRDSARETRVAVFRFKHFNSAKIKFKIMKNASQLSLVGICIIPPQHLPGIIIVQGGKRAIKFFTRLCLNRIQWEQDKCEMVWTSEIKDANFFKFKLISVESELELRRILVKKGAENYWNLVARSSDSKEMLV